MTTSADTLQPVQPQNRVDAHPATAPKTVEQKKAAVKQHTDEILRNVAEEAKAEFIGVITNEPNPDAQLRALKRIGQIQFALQTRLASGEEPNRTKLLQDAVAQWKVEKVFIDQAANLVDQGKDAIGEMLAEGREGVESEDAYGVYEDAVAVEIGEWSIYNTGEIDDDTKQEIQIRVLAELIAAKGSATTEQETDPREALAFLLAAAHFRAANNLSEEAMGNIITASDEDVLPEIQAMRVEFQEYVREILKEAQEKGETVADMQTRLEAQLALLKQKQGEKQQTEGEKAQLANEHRKAAEVAGWEYMQMIFKAVPLHKALDRLKIADPNVTTDGDITAKIAGLTTQVDQLTQQRDQVEAIRTNRSLSRDERQQAAIESRSLQKQLKIAKADVVMYQNEQKARAELPPEKRQGRLQTIRKQVEALQAKFGKAAEKLQKKMIEKEVPPSQAFAESLNDIPNNPGLKRIDASLIRRGVLAFFGRRKENVATFIEVIMALLIGQFVGEMSEPGV